MRRSRYVFAESAKTLKFSFLFSSSTELAKDPDCQETPTED